MKTTLYIDKNLVLRASEKGWPEVPPVQHSINRDMFLMRAYDKSLAQAKAESVPVIGDTIPNDISRKAFNPDSFVETDSEVEFVNQWKWLDGWKDCNEPEEYNERIKNGNKTRKIARLVKKECDDCFGSGTFGGGSYGDENCISCNGSGKYTGANSYYDAEREIKPINPHVAIGFKAQILEAFKREIDLDIVRKKRSLETLSKVLYELNIK